MRMTSHGCHPTALVGVAVVIIATACASPTVSVAPSPSTPVATDVCAPIDLRAPSGERVDLTGTWQQVGDGPLFYVSQDADCVWIVGRFVSAERGEPFGNFAGTAFAFDGHLRPDFTLQGRWVILDFFVQDRVSGTVTWALDVEGDPWTLQGTLTAGLVATLEKVSDRWIAPR